jgi:hypothetical protein
MKAQTLPYYHYLYLWHVRILSFRQEKERKEGGEKEGKARKLPSFIIFDVETRV